MQLSRRTLVGGAFIAGGMAAPASAVTQATGGARGYGGALNALSRYVEQHRADWGLPGMTVAVVDRGGYAGFIRSGWANVEKREPIVSGHLFQIGSITKMMAALTVYSLVQEGKLSLSAKLSALMPELNVRDGGDITLQHLLNHTSGLADDPPLFPDGGLWGGYAPGSHWSYCNVGYDIIGLIIARTDGRTFPDAVEARVLRPLGMTNSVGRIYVGDRGRYPQGYEPIFNDRAAMRPGGMAHTSWVDSDRGAGCVSATAGDMALFLRYLLGLAQGRGGPVLPDAAAAQFLADPAEAPGWAEGAKYGNGVARVAVDGRAYLHHTGGMVSFCSALHLDPEAGVAAFASSNVGYPLNYRPRDVTLHACRLFKAVRSGEAAPAPRPTRLSVERPERFAGAFAAADGDAFEVLADGDQVKLRRGGRETAMQQVGPAAFACADEHFAVSGLLFEAEGDAIVRAWADAREYLKDATRGYKPAPSDELVAFSGRYDNDDRWAGPLFVIARDGKLWLNNTDALTRLADGSYRIGEDEWSPERIRFDGIINGRPSRLLLSGAVFVRRFS